jgi:ATP-dependent DNA helicase RecQ
MLHRLLEAGLARQRDPDGVKFRPVIELTAAGVEVMKGERLPPASLADLLPKRTVVSERTTSRRIERDEVTPEEAMDPNAVARFERLRAVRLDLARQRQLPPYCICHDSALKLIAQLAPNDVESLEQIKGMGPYKVNMYGKVLLDAVRQA